MKTVTAAEMRSIDRCTIEELGIPGVVLMEHAGRAVFHSTMRIWGEQGGSGAVSVVCGRGNNGGDGFVVARHLRNHGVPVRVCALAEKDQISGDARINLDILEKMGVKVNYIKSGSELREVLDGSLLVVDAILGTGARGAPVGLVLDAIREINSLGVPVVAVDVPSGIDADTGAVPGDCVRAVETVTFGFVKRGLVMYPAARYTGRVIIADISIPEAALSELQLNVELVEPETVAGLLPELPPDAHKGNRGHVLFVGGSTGLTGAVTLSALASLRAGVGLTTVAVPRSLNGIMEVKLTEAMTKPVADTGEGSFAIEALEEVVHLSTGMGVLAVGPGIGRHPETGEFVKALLKSVKVPVVVDADGLYPFSGNPSLLKGREGPTIITPHPGEMGRLMGISTAQVQSDRVATARACARETGAIVVLKGAATVIAEPPNGNGPADGDVWINCTGNPGMATGGSGDVLTGVIAGLLCRGLSPSLAAVAGVFLHGLAGDIAAEGLGMNGVVAGDIVDRIPEAWVRCVKGNVKLRIERFS